MTMALNLDTPRRRTMSEAEYDDLYANPPKTRKGRAWQAAYLIRHGRACTRAYDDCFENGDGEQVLALLMQQVRDEPALRQMMKQQGAWSADYDRIPEPEPLIVGEAERIAGFRKATCGMAGSAARWQERAAKGMSDDELSQALAYEIGTFGGSSSPDGISVSYQAAGLKIWISWEIVNTHQTLPLFQGKATLAMARAVYGIADPSDRQMMLF
jgi:hypothetical protein